MQIAYHHRYGWKVNNLFSVLMVCSLKTYKGIYEFVEIAQAM